MYSLRILSKGKVTDLSNGFALGGVPFTRSEERRVGKEC